jgi:hypothetical protein
MILSANCPVMIGWRFDVLMAVKVLTFFWFLMGCDSVWTYRASGLSTYECTLHHKPEKKH